MKPAAKSTFTALSLVTLFALSNTACAMEEEGTATATKSMKASLRSFGKYVPRELVRDLVKTGEEAELKATLASFGGTAAKLDDDPEYYIMSHSTLTYLMLPGEGVVALFTRKLGPEELAEKTACYLEAA